jgi:hypothetical protein
MVQCVAWPLLLLLLVLILVANRTHFSESHPSLMDTVKSIWRFLFTLTCSYVGFNSLIIAVCRYVFIVHVTHNESLTIKRIRNGFLTTSIMVPIAVAILHEATVPKQESMMKGYTLDSDPSNNNTAINLEFHGNLNNTTSNTIGVVALDCSNWNCTAGAVPQSIVFMFVDTYFPSLIKTVMKVVTSFMKFAIFSNIFEGLIYLHIYIYDRKSEAQGVVSRILSETVRIRRQRRKTINIQMTIISWLIEFITGISVLAMYFLYKEAYIVLALAMFNIFVSFVVIPGTYILNTEACKRFVIAHGWCTALRRMCPSTRVIPLQNEYQKSNSHHNDVHRHKPTTQRIPTISGNISDREQGSKRTKSHV